MRFTTALSTVLTKSVLAVALLAAFLMPAASALCKRMPPSAAAEESESALQPWPEDGVLYRSGDAGEDGAKMIVHCNMSADRAAVVQLYAGEDELALYLFVSSGGEVTTALPGGVYRVELGVGTDWYGSEAAFGDDSWITDATIGCSGMYQDNSLELKAGLVYTIKLKNGNTPKEVTADDF